MWSCTAETEHDPVTIACGHQWSCNMTINVKAELNLILHAVYIHSSMRTGAISLLSAKKNIETIIL